MPGDWISQDPNHAVLHNSTPFEVHADTSHVYDQQAPDARCLTTQSLLNLSNCSDRICKVVTIFVLCHV